jgi:hypothetical protein
VHDDVPESAPQTGRHQRVDQRATTDHRDPGLPEPLEPPLRRVHRVPDEGDLVGVRLLVRGAEPVRLVRLGVHDVPLLGEGGDELLDHGTFGGRQRGGQFFECVLAGKRRGEPGQPRVRLTSGQRAGPVITVNVDAVRKLNESYVFAQAWSHICPRGVELRQC